MLKKQPGQHVWSSSATASTATAKKPRTTPSTAAQAAHAAIFAIYFKGEEERHAVIPIRTMDAVAARAAEAILAEAAGIPAVEAAIPAAEAVAGAVAAARAPSEAAAHRRQRDSRAHLLTPPAGTWSRARKTRPTKPTQDHRAAEKSVHAFLDTPDKDAADSVSHHLTLTSKKNDVWTLVQQDYSTAQ